MCNLLSVTLLIVQASGAPISFPESVSLAMVRTTDFLDAPRLGPTSPFAVFAHQARGRQRLPPAVRTGATIGGVVGLVTGVVLWVEKDCAELACSAKIVALPLFVFGYTVLGSAAGAGIGFVVHVLSPARDAQMRVGLRVPL
jgi:hypothetical protein